MKTEDASKAYGVMALLPAPSTDPFASSRFLPTACQNSPLIGSAPTVVKDWLLDPIQHPAGHADPHKAGPNVMSAGTNILVHLANDVVFGPILVNCHVNATPIRVNVGPGIQQQPNLVFDVQTSGHFRLRIDPIVARLEAQIQARAILASKDLSEAFSSLIEEDRFTLYDLSSLLGISRQALGTLRSRKVEKLRGETEHRLFNLLFSWKLWLRVASGDPLGPHLRTTLNGCSLADLIREPNADTAMVEAFINWLGPYSKAGEQARLHRRQNFAGLPVAVARELDA